jgi:hypothetical protein
MRKETPGDSDSDNMVYRFIWAFAAAGRPRAAEHAPVSLIGHSLIAMRSSYDPVSESAFSYVSRKSELVLSGSLRRTVYLSATACLPSWTKQGISTVPAILIPSKSWRIFGVRRPQMMSWTTVLGRSVTAPSISKYG